MQGTEPYPTWKLIKNTHCNNDSTLPSRPATFARDAWHLQSQLRLQEMHGTFKVSYVLKEMHGTFNVSYVLKEMHGTLKCQLCLQEMHGTFKVSYVLKRCMAPSMSAMFARDAWQLQSQLCLQETHGIFKVI